MKIDNYKDKNEDKDIKFIGNQSDLADWRNTIDGMMKLDTATECQKREIEEILSSVSFNEVKYFNIPHAKKYVHEKYQDRHNI
ncbi:TPA: hypothetical protein KDX48_002322 [Vibrio parahaemolyticus]|nr:hypothetical protein [Vibrio parahaemolyticus]